MNIAVIGLGYVGLANALLLSQHENVTACDIDEEKIAQLTHGKSPIKDKEIKSFLAKRHELMIQFTQDIEEAVKDADYVIVATPTDYDVQKNYFNTSTVEHVIKRVFEIRTESKIIIKSTVPVGFTEMMRQRFSTDRILFIPEFLREGKALYDSLYPSRIVIGDRSGNGHEAAGLFKRGMMLEQVPVLLTNPSEAEAIKLFSNTYLALRIAYINELDTYAEIRNLNSQQIIEGIGLDPRIGGHYNNPSFGYGGYCLPKDTKQLRANYMDIPNNLIGAIVEANDTRKDFIARQIIKKKPKIVGIHRLAMKTDSDNFRYSSIQGVMRRLREAGLTIVIFEPTLAESEYQGCQVIHDCDSFQQMSDIILANRMDEQLKAVKEKVYTRDLFGND